MTLKGRLRSGRLCAWPFVGGSEIVGGASCMRCLLVEERCRRQAERDCHPSARGATTCTVHLVHARRRFAFSGAFSGELGESRR